MSNIKEVDREGHFELQHSKLGGTEWGKTQQKKVNAQARADSRNKAKLLKNCSLKEVGRGSIMFPKGKCQGNRLGKLFKELEWDEVWLIRIRTWTVLK